MTHSCRTVSVSLENPDYIPSSLSLLPLLQTRPCQLRTPLFSRPSDLSLGFRSYPFTSQRILPVKSGRSLPIEILGSGFRGIFFSSCPSKFSLICLQARGVHLSSLADGFHAATGLFSPQGLAQADPSARNVQPLFFLPFPVELVLTSQVSGSPASSKDAAGSSDRWVNCPSLMLPSHPSDSLHRFLTTYLCVCVPH